MNCMGHGVIKMHSATSDIATLLGLQNVLGITMTVTILSPNLSSEPSSLEKFTSKFLHDFKTAGDRLVAKAV